MKRSVLLWLVALLAAAAAISCVVAASPPTAVADADADADTDAMDPELLEIKADADGDDDDDDSDDSDDQANPALVEIQADADGDDDDDDSDDSDDQANPALVEIQADADGDDDDDDDDDETDAALVEIQADADGDDDDDDDDDETDAALVELEADGALAKRGRSRAARRGGKKSARGRRVRRRRRRRRRGRKVRKNRRRGRKSRGRKSRRRGRGIRVRRRRRRRRRSGRKSRGRATKKPAPKRKQPKRAVKPVKPPVKPVRKPVSRKVRKAARRRNPFLVGGRGKDGKCTKGTDCQSSCCDGYCCPAVCTDKKPFGMGRCATIRVVHKRPRYARSCLAIKQAAARRKVAARSGRRLIEVAPGQIWSVYCDQTTQGGGWTSLLNPAGRAFATEAAPGFNMQSYTLAGTASRAHANCAKGGVLGLNRFVVVRQPQPMNAIMHYNCGTHTGGARYEWNNALGAKEVLLQATVQGYSGVSVRVNGRNLNGAQLRRGPEAGGCYRVANSPRAHPVVRQPNACWRTFQAKTFSGLVLGGLKRRLVVEITAGPAGQPAAAFGVGWNVQRLMVR